MHKKPFVKIVALVALFAIILLSAPGLSSAEKKASKFDFRLLIKKPALWISSVLDMFIPIFDRGDSGTSKNTTPTTAPGNSSFKIRPLGDSLSVRPSQSD
jgi:hypothetical protein